MPALVVLGRQLRLGSDDLALPSTLGAFWQGAWAAIVALDLAFVVRQLGHTCPYRKKHMAFLSTHLGVLALTAALRLAVIWASAQGSLFQLAHRRPVGPLLLALVLCSIATVGSNAYGSHLLALHRSFSGDAGCASVLPGPLRCLRHISVLKAIVIATWVQLFLSTVRNLVVFRLLPVCSSGSGWVKRLHLVSLCCFCCCLQLGPAPGERSRGASHGSNGGNEPAQCGNGGGGGELRHADSPVMVIARSLLHLFGGVDMTLTDYIAALTLVGVRHRHTKTAHTYRSAPPPEWLRAPHGAASCRVSDSVVMTPPVVMTLHADSRAAPVQKTPPASPLTGSIFVSGDIPQPQQQVSQPRSQPASGTIELVPQPQTPANDPTQTNCTAAGDPTTSAHVASTTPVPPSHQRLAPIKTNTVHYINATGQAAAPRQMTPLSNGDTSAAFGATAMAPAHTGGGDAGELGPPDGTAQLQQERLPRLRMQASCSGLSPHGDLSPATSRVFGRASLPSGETPALLHPHREWSGQPAQANTTADVLEEALHYYRYATAVYGWMMYIWLNRTRVTHCCGLCLGRGCGCCRQSTYFLRPVGPDVGPPESACSPVKLLQREAITQVAGVPDSDILYVCYANEVGGLLPYYIAVDRERRALVLAVRGSWSADDIITDLLCEAAPLDLPGVSSEDASGRCDLWAHRGILASSRAIAADIRRQGVLAAALAEWPAPERQGPEGPEAAAAWLAGLPSERARSVASRLRGQCAGWQLVLTGHSLGAGVAALLGLLLRQEFPGLRCWAYAPPGGLVSPQVAELTRQFCIGVVHAKDVIPRLAVATMDQLVQELVTAGAHCRLSKAVVLWRLVVLGQQPAQAEVFQPAHDLCPEQQAALEAYCRRMREQAAASPFAGTRDFQPPGHLLYIERHPKRRGDAGGGSGSPTVGFDAGFAGAAAGGCCGGARCSCNVCLLDTGARGARYTCRFIQVEDLMSGGLVVSRSMLTDHFPDHILWAMEQAYHQAREAGGLLWQPSTLRMPAALPSRVWKRSHSSCTATVTPIATPGATPVAAVPGPAELQQAAPATST